MPKVNFTKMVASGNDFVVVDANFSLDLTRMARLICDRKFGIGADGLLLLTESKKADIKMRIFNADGSEAQMCGNGARCAALFTGKQALAIETKAGLIRAKMSDGAVKIKLTDPKEIKLDLPISVSGRELRVNFINTGVPHTVIFVEGLENLDVPRLGREIRFHKQFSPAGTNVDLVEAQDRDIINVRTYERGVEDETLACGTGSVASALIFSLKGARGNKINVRTKSGEVLKVNFKKERNKFRDVWLEGKARIVYKGEYYV